jgi:hypothetical protein
MSPLARKGRRIGAACVVASLVLSPGVTAAVAIHRCTQDDARCPDVPVESVVIPPPDAESWSRQATEAVLAGHARELAKWSREAVVVASDIPVHLPRRHRLVRDKAAGELVVSRFEVRRAPNGSTIAEIKVDFLGATCDGQSERFSNTVSIGTGSSSQGDASTCS